MRCKRFTTFGLMRAGVATRGLTPLRKLGVIGLLGMGVLSFSAPLNAETIDHFVSELKRGRVPLDTLVAMKTLDAGDEQIGYGLCMVAKRQECVVTGSLGYGLCMASGRNGCVKTGSLGYGLCMAGNRAGCDVQGSLSYGLCMAANRSGCQSEL